MLDAENDSQNIHLKNIQINQAVDKINCAVFFSMASYLGMVVKMFNTDIVLWNFEYISLAILTFFYIVLTVALYNKSKVWALGILLYYFATQISWILLTEKRVFNYLWVSIIFFIVRMLYQWIIWTRSYHKLIGIKEIKTREIVLATVIWLYILCIIIGSIFMFFNK